MTTAKQKIENWAKGYYIYIFLEKDGSITSGDNLDYAGGELIGAWDDGELINIPKFEDDKPEPSLSQKLWEQYLHTPIEDIKLNSLIGSIIDAIIKLELALEAKVG